MLLVIILAQLIVFCSTGSAKVGYEYFPEVNGWLKMHVEPADWRTARSNCHNEGALLASPWSPGFEPAVRKLMSTRLHTTPKIYSGAGLRLDSPGIPLEPCDNKRCRVFLAGGATDKVRCDDQLPYVCYAPEISCPAGYESKGINNKCYKLHNNKSIYSEAQRICQEEGAYLAIFTNSDELQMMKDMVDNAFYTYIGVFVLLETSLLSTETGRVTTLCYDVICKKDLFGGIFFASNGLFNLTKQLEQSGGSTPRHLDKSTYSDYPCDQEHPFICESAKTYVKDMID